MPEESTFGAAAKWNVTKLRTVPSNFLKRQDAGGKEGMEQYTRWVTAIVACLLLAALVCCGTGNEITPATDVTNTITKSTSAANATDEAANTKGKNAITIFSSGSQSKSWIQGTVTKSDSVLKTGTILNISGQLARVPRYPGIQVTLYQSKELDYQHEAIQLVQSHLPVFGSAKFAGTLIVPDFHTSNGSYFTLLFKYQGVSPGIAVVLQK